jgi:hypothetical protein
MKLTKLLATMAVVGMSIATSPSFASITFTFDPTGAGGAGVTGDILEWAPGSTVAIGGAGGGSVIAEGTVLTNLYQASLSAVQLGAGNNVYSNGAGGDYFTIVARFTEQVTFAGGNATTGTNVFNILGGSFIIYSQNALANELTGTGFAGTGTPILSGTITGGNANVTAFFTQTGTLDQANDDDWGGTTTIATTGGSNIFATITGVDAGYFPDLLVGGSFTFAALNASLITPFNQVDPSRAFSSNLVADGDFAANIGAVNGVSGPNFIFQTDANSSFTRAVPEPGSLALAGLALAGVSLMSRRRKQAVKDVEIA